MKKFLRANILNIILALTLILFIFASVLMFNTEGKITFVDEKPLEDTFTKKYIYISGAVTNPGVYEITNEMRVNDAISQAGGLLEDADLAYINNDLNLATIVQDGDHISIPFNPTDQTVKSSESNSSNLISINTATQSELTSLSGVGEKTAEKIINGRPYQTLEDLKNVEGIGDKTFENLKPYISL